MCATSAHCPHQAVQRIWRPDCTTVASRERGALVAFLLYQRRCQPTERTRGFAQIGVTVVAIRLEISAFGPLVPGVDEYDPLVRACCPQSTAAGMFQPSAVLLRR